jgi:hypothetical protein
MASPTIFNKAKLSGSTDGKGIKVVATSSTGTTIHTAVSGTTANTFDEIWLWAVNSDSTARKLTIEWGQTTAPDGNIEQTIPPESGLFLVVPGLILQNGLVVTAFCATANVVMIHGYVNEIKP